MHVILLAAISADGKIAERDGQTSLDWTSKEDTRFFVEKTKEVGVVIMGRKTFETIGKPLKGRRLVVLTNRPAVGENVSGPADSSPLFPSTYSPTAGLAQTIIPPTAGTVEFTNLSPHQLLQELKQQGHDAVVVAGGASIYSLFLREGLVTEAYLTIEPVLFGRGIPLASDFDRIDLHLVNVSRLGEHAVLLTYRCINS